MRLAFGFFLFVNRHLNLGKTPNATETKSLATSGACTQPTVISALVNNFSSVNFRVFCGFQLLVLGLFISLLTTGVPALAQELFMEKSDLAPAEVDRIYVKGLQYLGNAQTPDGSWGDTTYGKEPAVVGLAVISMLAHGDEPNFGPYAEP